MPTNDMINAHLVYLRASGYSANTVDDARKLLALADRSLPYGLDTASRVELNAWLANEDWSPNTRNTYWKHVVRFYRWAADPADPWLDCNPLDGQKGPKPARGLPRPATTEQVLRAVSESAMPWRVHCVLAAYAGLRAFEIAQLRRERISVDTLTVVRGKGGRDRVVPTHPKVWKVIEPLPLGPVTWRATGIPPTADWVSSETGAYLHNRLGMAVTLHNLRHWFATNLLRAYKDLRVVQELMGHTSPATTAVYTLVTSDQRRAAIDLLPDDEASDEDGDKKP